MLIMSRIIMTLGFVMGVVNLARYYLFEQNLAFISSSAVGYMIGTFGLIMLEVAQSEEE